MIQVVKNLPAIQETQETRVWALGWKDPPDKKMATHSNILAQKISWTEEPGGLWSMGSQRVGHKELVVGGDWAQKHSQYFSTLMVPRCPLEQNAPGGSLPLATVLTIFQMTVVWSVWTLQRRRHGRASRKYIFVVWVRWDWGSLWSTSCPVLTDTGCSGETPKQICAVDGNVLSALKHST